MRIISQNGSYDVPYKMAAVECEGRYVNAWMPLPEPYREDRNDE